MLYNDHEWVFLVITDFCIGSLVFLEAETCFYFLPFFLLSFGKLEGIKIGLFISFSYGLF